MESVRQYLAADRFASHCGMELLSVGEGQAVVTMSIEPWHMNAHGTVQGGAIFTLADFAFAAASNSHGSVAVGVSVTINYVKRATTGTLRAEAREVARSARLGTYLVDVRDAGGEIVAVFQGLVYRKKEPILPPTGAQS